MSFGNDFSEITFIDGAGPPINADNLNSIETLAALTDEELRRSKTFNLKTYLQYFRKRNTKDIYLFQNYAAMTNYRPADCTLTQEVTNKKVGNECLKVTIDDNGADWLGFYTNVSTLDLTTFNDTSASTTADFIILMLYISDIDSITGQTIYVNIGDTVGANTYEYDIDVDAWNLDTGWNCVWMLKSDFYVWAGAPNWNNVDYLQIEVDFNAGYQNEYFYFQFMQMIRSNPDDSDYPSPFQVYNGSVSGWENLLEIDYQVYSIIDDPATQVNQLGIMKLNPGNYEAPYTPDNYKNALLLYNNISSFTAKFEFRLKDSSNENLPSVTWYVDNTHYIEVYINSGTFYLDVANGGAPVQTSKALGNTLYENEITTIYIEKNNDTIRAICNKDYEYCKICEYESTFTDDGDVFIGVYDDDSFGLLTNFNIGYNISLDNYIDRNEVKVIRKGGDQLRYNTSVPVDDASMWAYLAPNQAYKIEFYGSVSNAISSIPGFKWRWDTAGITEIGERHYIGPADGTTDPRDCSMLASVSTLSTSVIAGVGAGVYESNIQDTFFIKTGENGGYLMLQWAQGTAATTNTYLEESSFLVFTPIKMSKR